MNNGKMKRMTATARVVLVVLLVLGFVLVGAFWMRYNELEARNEELAAQVLAAKENNDKLREEISAPFDADYVRRVARRTLGYCMPGEIIYFNDLKD